MTSQNTKLMENPFSYINKTVLEISVLDFENRKRNLDFDWNVTDIQNERLYLNLYFDDPLNIS